MTMFGFVFTATQLGVEEVQELVHCSLELLKGVHKCRWVVTLQSGAGEGFSPIQVSCCATVWSWWRAHTWTGKLFYNSLVLLKGFYKHRWVRTQQSDDVECLFTTTDEQLHNSLDLMMDVHKCWWDNSLMLIMSVHKYRWVPQKTVWSCWSAFTNPSELLHNSLILLKVFTNTHELLHNGLMLVEGVHTHKCVITQQSGAGEGCLHTQVRCYTTVRSWWRCSQTHTSYYTMV